MAHKNTCPTLAKIGDDEPIFVLRAQDELAARVVRFWATLAANHRVDEEKVAEAMRCSAEMERWPGRKKPD